MADAVAKPGFSSSLYAFLTRLPVLLFERNISPNKFRTAPVVIGEP